MVNPSFKKLTNYNKICMLNAYCDAHPHCTNAKYARVLAKLIKASIIVHFSFPLIVIDNILSKCKIEYKLTKYGQEGKLINFCLSKEAIEQIYTLSKYLNHEIKKLENNTQKINLI